MVIILWLSLMVNIILWGANLYKARVIQDYETRLPRLYQEFVDDVRRCKSYLDFEERASRETNVRKELNYMIDKYASYCRKEQSKFEDIEDILEEASKGYIKKN